ncbi:peptidase C14, caspase domain-containing protein [Desarmillaria tabescens]|uniref:Peptidase C14, caspase domain-containing protein n=1 Tax=Armillaria tabescens TaxID=1929756 RepID=A0AA39KC23_ARMTA|nr:peptidase C14, caspase domain-containing protein [Desarmillaria tabescens]KAK0457091.1 peptidase C14, caspase domain-containing protein [Desarmillaria tabescens]
MWTGSISLHAKCHDTSRFYAVLIGIDEYASFPLNGCVSDVRLMKKYLTKDLGVPHDRIQLLLGSEEHISPEDPKYPSRTHIIDALLGIITNPQIKSGDNIIIYYAGHGSYYPPQSRKPFSVNEYIDTLCPIDRDIVNNGKPVPDISDREFNTILTLISRVKGDHITVILDCCHSGSISRGLPEPGAHTTYPMAHATLHDMLVAGEERLKEYPGYRSILEEGWLSDMDSHVVLVACKKHQFAKAKEVDGTAGAVEYIGIFTDSLVRTLQSDCYKKETTYADLVHFLDKTPHQTPVVAGKCKDARVWYQE